MQSNTKKVFHVPQAYKTRQPYANHKKNVSGRRKVAVCIWKGSVIGSVAGLLFIISLSGLSLNTGLGVVADIEICILLAIALMTGTGGISRLLLGGVRALFRLVLYHSSGSARKCAVNRSFYLRRMDLRGISMLLGVVFSIFVIDFATIPWQLAAVFAVVGALSGMFAGVMIALRRNIRVFAMLLLPVIFINAFFAQWLFGPGTDGPLIRESKAAFRTVPLNISNPSEYGSYPVKTLFYGSGTDKRRIEYGEKVDLITNTVDLSDMIDKSCYDPTLPGFEGVQHILRKLFWGFDPSELPLNGRVWAPEGQGPFPLVLIVHGNHSMEEFSDTGYDYLGELLASRGFISVSVDENFLNSSWSGDIDFSTNILSRAVILLQHLEVWEQFTKTPGNPFYGKVDMDNVAIVGHSRGGEAAAVAAYLTQYGRIPSYSHLNMNTDFTIKSVVSIAPCDSSYQPFGVPIALRDINYLLLQGGYDGDVSTMSGIAQYGRISFSGNDYCLKSAVYAYRANHGQFNTVWGKRDSEFPRSFLENIQPMLQREEQQKIAQVYIAGFMEATLHQEHSYIEMFKNQNAIKHWLPDDIYVTRFADSHFQPVENYENVISTVPEEHQTYDRYHHGFQAFEIQDVLLRDRWNSTQQNRALYIRWEVENSAGVTVASVPEYSLELKNWSLAGKLTENSELVFSLANGRDNLEPVDLSIALSDSWGRIASVSLSSFACIQPPLETQLSKSPWIEDFGIRQSTEIVFQTCRIPLKRFIDAVPGFTADQLQKISFVFNRSLKGDIYIDDIGFDI